MSEEAHRPGTDRPSDIKALITLVMEQQKILMAQREDHSRQMEEMKHAKNGYENGNGKRGILLELRIMGAALAILLGISSWLLVDMIQGIRAEMATNARELVVVTKDLAAHKEESRSDRTALREVVNGLKQESDREWQRRNRR